MKIEKNKKGIAIVFYRKKGDRKYSFYIKNNPELTKRLLSHVKTKRVREDKIRYAAQGIFKLILNNKLKNKNTMEKNINPIIRLNEMCQAQFGESIKTEVLSKTGQDHCPVVKVRITLPNGCEYTAKGSNKRVAKQKAAKKAFAALWN